MNRRDRKLRLNGEPSELFRRTRRRRQKPFRKTIGYRLGSALDAMISVVAPQWGAQRRASRENAAIRSELKSEFTDELKSRAFKQIDRTDPTRSERVAYDNVSINALLEDNISDAQAHSVTEYGQNGMAHAAVESRVAYEVGQGLKLQPLIRQSEVGGDDRAELLNVALKDNIDDWSDHGVDKSRTMSFPQAQRLAVRNFANYGEDFVLLGTAPYYGDVDTAIEFFTPERCETPPRLLNDPLVRMGVQYSSSGEVLGYWMRNSVPNDNKEFDFDHTFYPRFDPETGQPRMVHLFEPMFSGQARGIPWLMASFRKLSDMDDFVEAEIIAKQVEACFGLVFKIDDTGGKSLDEIATDAAAETTTDGNLMEDIAPGFIQRLGSDDEVQTIDPQRPGSNFAPFVEIAQRMISGQAGLPYEALAKNFSRVTFASGRLSMLDGDMSFRMRRSTFIHGWMKPIYRRVTYDRVTMDELGGMIQREEFIRNKKAFLRHSWRGQPMGLIDPVKEITGYKMAHEEDIMSLSDIHAERGTDFEAMESKKLEEGRKRIDRRLALEQYEMEQREQRGLPEMPSHNQGDEEPVAVNDNEQDDDE